MYRARKTLWVIRWRRWSEDILFGVEEVGREGGEGDEEAGEGSGFGCICV